MKIASGHVQFNIYSFRHTYLHTYNTYIYVGENKMFKRKLLLLAKKRERIFLMTGYEVEKSKHLQIYVCNTSKCVNVQTSHNIID